MDPHITEYLNARLLPLEIPGARPVAGTVPGPVAKLRAWQKKRWARRDLQALDDRLLADIGLDRAAIGSVFGGLVASDSGKSPAANDNSAARAA